jgi:hypothetical protein
MTISIDPIVLQADNTNVNSVLIFQGRELRSTQL